MTTQRLNAFGAGWDLDVSGLGEPMAGRLRTLWARAASGPEPGGEVLPYVVARDGDDALSVAGVPHRASDDELPYLLSRALTMASIRRRTGQCLMLHAAGVCTPDGSTVALVAASGTGKTTAARLLGQHLGYVSDETVAVEDDLTVRPWAKPLSVLVDPRDPFDKTESGPDELGLARAPEHLRLGAVVLLARDPGHGEPVLEPVPLVEALAEVVPQTSALLRLERPMESVVAALTAGGGPWRLRYSEVADCVDLVAGLAGGSGASQPAIRWTTERGGEPALIDDDASAASAPPMTPEPPDVDLPAGALVQRTSFQHAVHAEGASFVVRGQVPAVLPDLASTVWRAASEPVSVRDLVDVAVEQHGAHPEAEQLVTATVTALLASGHVAPAGGRHP
ncbi:ATP-binding protein [Phycicoccus sonneratiae]|uniref:ATP-binding protein n=1 Tax=Phycicoccus sonneratiae TaxID=2807628 RepID=A0ABS2CMX9_9MICO|nr:ATP-binding protein [Phycicoccus sonneraticus]MBM6401175.1 ATP-binding protein [Phycicoccus sonneraticus]